MKARARGARPNMRVLFLEGMPPSQRAHYKGEEGEKNQPPGVNPSVTGELYTQKVNRTAQKIQLVRSPIDSDLGISSFVVIGTLDRAKMDPGVPLASSFLGR